MLSDLHFYRSSSRISNKVKFQNSVFLAPPLWDLVIYIYYCDVIKSPYPKLIAYC